MKKILLYLFIISAVLSACKKEPDPVFDMTPEERINKVLGDYQSTLTASQYGWNATLVTAVGGVYHFHFSFNNDNRIKMYGDVDTTTAVVQKESSFRLRMQQRPSLIFDTYSYIHQLADPDASVSNGDYGIGLYSDFEFSLDTLMTDSIRLTGRFQGSKMVLKKATQADLQTWQNGQWKNSLLFEYTGRYLLNYFKRIVTTTRSYQVSVDAASRVVTFSWVDANNTLHTHSTAYYFTAAGVVLEDPLVDGSNNITSITGITWNGTRFNISLNGSTAASIQGTGTPVKVDLAAPKRWWDTQANIRRYWYSWSGFHVDGVDDAYGLTRLPGFYQLIYWPAAAASFDLAAFGFIMDDALEIPFGPAFGNPPTFTADGRVIFTYLGAYVDTDIYDDIPEEMVDEFVNTRGKFIDPLGFYLIQTGANSYDMVSARDGKTWITWQK